LEKTIAVVEFRQLKEELNRCYFIHGKFNALDVLFLKKEKTLTKCVLFFFLKKQSSYLFIDINHQFYCKDLAEAYMRRIADPDYLDSDKVCFMGNYCYIDLFAFINPNNNNNT
jgi:hypothetical protein